MAIGDASIERLARLMGLAEPAGEEFDWVAVEASLGGQRLPQDYKDFVERFPRVAVNGVVNVVRPGDTSDRKTEYLGHLAYLLEAMRSRRDAGNQDFPHPIFPEPGGVLPWGLAQTGWAQAGELFLWVTSPSDPDTWSVVWLEVSKKAWHPFAGTMTEFLVALVSGEVDGLAPPEPMEELKPRRWGMKWPVNEAGELIGSVGRPAQPPQTVDLAALEAKLSPLPSDYREFIESVGVGTFCDILIAGPDPCPEFDILNLLHEQMVQIQTSQPARLILGYGRGPIIPWGRRPDGWIFGWSLATPDPNTWGIATIAPDFMARSDQDELSFSTFLLHYCGRRDPSRVSFQRLEPWPGAPTFHPHRHE